MDDKKVDAVSYLVYESSQTRSDRIINRLIGALIVMALLFFISNALWLWAWSQRTEHIEESNYIGNDGTINNETTN